MASEVHFSSRAYCKIMLHAAKYPHCSVNGVLLADSTMAKEAKKGKPLVFVDTVPLFHLCLHVSPMAEIALMQIDAMASAQGLVIAGYYFGNEILDDMSIDKPSSRIADKIAETFPNACLVVIDNKKVTLGMEEVAIKVMQSIEGKWKNMDTTSYTVDERCLEVSSALLMQQAQEDIADFDNHLDDLCMDWKNININERVDDIIGDTE